MVARTISDLAHTTGPPHRTSRSGRQNLTTASSNKPTGRRCRKQTGSGHVLGVWRPQYLSARGMRPPAEAEGTQPPPARDFAGSQAERGDGAEHKVMSAGRGGPRRHQQGEAGPGPHSRSPFPSGTGFISTFPRLARRNPWAPACPRLSVCLPADLPCWPRWRKREERKTLASYSGEHSPRANPQNPGPTSARRNSAARRLHVACRCLAQAYVCLS